MGGAFQPRERNPTPPLNANLSNHWKPRYVAQHFYMTDVFTTKKRSAVMAAIRSAGNKDTEIKLARILRQHGITGWRRHQKIFGKPDFIFRKARLAVFVDGCFWHGCPQHGHQPKSNKSYWRSKLLRNKQRDRETTEILRDMNWEVLRFWEHDLMEDVKVVAALRRMIIQSTRKIADVRNKL